MLRLMGGWLGGLICVVPLAGRKWPQGEWGQCACERQLARHVSLDVGQVRVRPGQAGVGPGGEWQPSVQQLLMPFRWISNEPFGGVIENKVYWGIRMTFIPHKHTCMHTTLHTHTNTHISHRYMTPHLTCTRTHTPKHTHVHAHTHTQT